MSHTRRLLAISIYTLTTLFLLFEMALQVSPSVMTRELMHDFKIQAITLGVMVSFYFYSYTLMQIPVGILFDRFNARTLVTLAILICSLGAFFFGLTSNVYYAALGRFLMGIGSAFAFVGVLVVAARWFPARYFAFLVGIAQLLAALGALMGELPIAAALDHLTWRQVLSILGGIGMVLTLISLIIVRDTPHSKRTVPPQHHLFKELKEIIRSKQTWWIGLYAFCGWGPVAVFAALWGVPYLRLRYAVSTTHAALAMAMVWIGIGITSPILGYLSDKLGRRCILLRFCSLIGLLCSLVLLSVPAVSFGFSFLLLLGVGIAAGGQILTFALVKDNNRSTTTGTAIGLNNMAVVAGGALFQPFVGWILHLLWEGQKDLHGIPLYSVENYHMGLLIVPICFFIGLVTSSFFIQETYCRPRFPDTSSSPNR